MEHDRHPGRGPIERYHRGQARAFPAVPALRPRTVLRRLPRRSRTGQGAAPPLPDPDRLPGCGVAPGAAVGQLGRGDPQPRHTDPPQATPRDAAEVRAGWFAVSPPDAEPTYYEIRVGAVLDECWSEWLGSLTANTTESGETLLSGLLAD